MRGETEALAAFASGLSFPTLSDAVRREALRAVVNALGCAVGGARHDIVETAAAALMPHAGAPVAVVLGRGQRSDALTAALLNGLSGGAYSFDDTWGDAMLHPSGPILSALLALAEARPVTGPDLLTAFAAGLEAACRISKALTVAPAEPELAWSQTGVVAGIGAAIAGARLLGLDTAGMVGAIGIAVSQASGTRASHGSMTATLIFGHAAQTGARAALLAQGGFTASPAALEHKMGLGALYARKPDLAAITDNLGRDYLLLANTYKPFPCGLVIHPALDGILQLRPRFAAAVAGVSLRVSKGAMQFGWNPDPKTDIAAKVSLPHWVAAALHTGRAGLAEGRIEVVQDPEVRRLRALIKAEADPALAQDQAEVIVTLADGAQHRVFVEHAVGGPHGPMTDDQLSQKFLGQAALTLGETRARDLLARTWALPDLNDVTELTALAL